MDGRQVPLEQVVPHAVGNIGSALGGTGVASTVSGLAAVAASVTGLGV